MPARRAVGIGVVALVILTVVIVAVVVLTARQTSDTEAAAALVSPQTLAKLARADNSQIDTSHVGSGVVPPTNKWFSGLALQKTPEPVFPLPLSFVPTASGFSFGLPAVSTTADTISGGNAPAVTVAIDGAKDYKVTRYDAVSVDLTYDDASGTPLGTVTIAEGSPYVFYRANSDSTVSVTMDGAAKNDNDIQAEIGNATYHATISGGEQSLSGGTIKQTVKKGSLLTYYAIPDGQKDELAAYAHNGLTDTSVNHVTRNDTSTTEIDYHTANGKPTVIAALPHQSVPSGILTYSSIYGPMHVLTNTNKLSFSVPAVTATPQLAITKLPSAQKAVLDTQLKTDAQKLNFQDDTYGGGKALYRAAQLLDIAEQLGDQQTAGTLKSSLEQELSAWYTPASDAQAAKSFYYNPIIRGIVGVTPSFGSEQFNDHHFHYGYFIYASSIVGRYDKDFIKKYEPMVNLLVADIANDKDNGSLPLRRMYDPYFSHSWASGSSPFADGNNQESSAEAINAWTAVALWSAITGDKTLASEAQWLLSGEMASAQAYWLSPPQQSGYDHTIVALNWGGKRDYKTFFSDAAAAKLAIQLIPMNPTEQGLPITKVVAQLAEAVPDGNFNVALGDYLLMYEGLVDKNKALQLVKTQDDKYIDTADSKTYLLAWLMTV